MEFLKLNGLWTEYANLHLGRLASEAECHLLPVDYRPNLALLSSHENQNLSAKKLVYIHGLHLLD